MSVFFYGCITLEVILLTKTITWIGFIKLAQ